MIFVLWSYSVFYSEGENKDSWGECYSVKFGNRAWFRSFNFVLLFLVDFVLVFVLGMIVAVLFLIGF